MNDAVNSGKKETRHFHEAIPQILDSYITASLALREARILLKNRLFMQCFDDLLAEQRSATFPPLIGSVEVIMFRDVCWLSLCEQNVQLPRACVSCYAYLQKGGMCMLILDLVIKSRAAGVVARFFFFFSTTLDVLSPSSYS
jgi:hypothetical protein